MLDEVIKQEFSFQAHTEELIAKLTQPTENIILERNAMLRKDPTAMRDLGVAEGKSKTTTQSWGRQIASIPEIMFMRAIKDGFDLNNSDAKFADKEMHRYLATSEGKKCLLGQTG